MLNLPGTALSIITAVKEKVTYTSSIVVENASDPDYFTIEGMRSHEYSVGIFIFMVFGIVVFAAILYNFFFSSKGEAIKTGEKVMFAWILLGLIVATAFGAAQLLFGRLF